MIEMKVNTVGDPPSPLSDLRLVWDWNSYIGRIVYHFLTGWFFQWNASCILPLNWILEIFNEICLYNLCYQAQEKDVPRVRPSRIEFKYTVSRGQGIITCNRDWWDKVGGVWGPVFNSIQPWMVFEPSSLNLTWISSRLFTLLLPNLVILPVSRESRKEGTNFLM